MRAVLKLERDNPDIRYILIAADGINLLDASGVEMLWNLAERLRQSGITLAFGGVKAQVAAVMERTGLMNVVRPENVFASANSAIDNLRARANAGA